MGGRTKKQEEIGKWAGRSGQKQTESRKESWTPATTMKREEQQHALPPPPPRKSLPSSVPSLSSPSKKKKLLQSILLPPNPNPNPNPNPPLLPDPYPTTSSSPHLRHPLLLPNIRHQKQRLPQPQSPHYSSELHPPQQRPLHHHRPQLLQQFAQQPLSSPTDLSASQDQGGASSPNPPITREDGEENGSKAGAESEKSQHSRNTRRRGRSTQRMPSSPDESRKPKRPSSHSDGEEPLRRKSQPSPKVCKPSGPNPRAHVRPPNSSTAGPVAVRCDVSLPPISSEAGPRQATESRMDPILAEGGRTGMGDSESGAARTSKLRVDSAEAAATHVVPSKQVLKGVLDDLQKKDKLGVFSDPVDAQEVPGYYDIIKEPMDFGTMRERIAAGYYVNLELFEKDVFQICNNAMTFNAVGTVYYRHGRIVKIAAEKCFQDLKANLCTSNGGDETAMRRKISFKKSHKKKVVLKTSMPSPNSKSCHASEAMTGIGECHTTTRAENMNDQTIIIGGASPGYVTKSVEVRKSISTEENRRNTYRPSSKRGNASITTPSLQFIPAAYQAQFCYAKSLARFAADLGPPVWRTAANKIRRALPPDVPFGPGWIGEGRTPD